MKNVVDLRRHNLARLVDEHGLATIARKAGKPASQINDMVVGRKSFGEKVARSLEKALDPVAPPMWLDAESNFAGVIPGQGNAAASDIAIPQFDTGGKMGNGLELRDQPGIIKSWNVSLDWLNQNVRGATSAANLCIVTGFGDSMQPMFNPGDPLLVDRGVREAAYDAVYFFRVGHEGFIKRLQRIPGKGLVALSENSAYQSWVIEPDMDFEIFGRVLIVWRSQLF